MFKTIFKIDSIEKKKKTLALNPNKETKNSSKLCTVNSHIWAMDTCM